MLYIVTKQMFREVQAEMARRNSKSAANHRSKRKGKYSNKYALSERLVCGECGCAYKRVTWNIHGRKQIVWRCTNRIENGTRYCSASPSVPEEKLHRAILDAIQDLAASYTNRVQNELNDILYQVQNGKNTDENLQQKLEQAQAEFDRLLEMSLELDENTPFLDSKLKTLSDEIRKMKKDIAENPENQKSQHRSGDQLSAGDLQIKAYNDALTRRIIEKITVVSRNEIEIWFVGGYTRKATLA